MCGQQDQRFPNKVRIAVNIGNCHHYPQLYIYQQCSTWKDLFRATSFIVKFWRQMEAVKNIKILLLLSSVQEHFLQSWWPKLPLHEHEYICSFCATCLRCSSLVKSYQSSIWRQKKPMHNSQLEHATINNIKHYHSIITEKKSLWNISFGISTIRRPLLIEAILCSVIMWFTFSWCYVIWSSLLKFLKSLHFVLLWATQGGH